MNLSFARHRGPGRAPLEPRSRGHEEAAAGAMPAAALLIASVAVGQRERDISSARPCSYAASRESLSASS